MKEKVDVIERRGGCGGRKQRPKDVICRHGHSRFSQQLILGSLNFTFKGQT